MRGNVEKQKVESGKWKVESQGKRLEVLDFGFHFTRNTSRLTVLVFSRLVFS